MVFESLRKNIDDIIGLEGEEFELTTLLFDDLDMDSLDMSQLLVALEKEFKIDIEDKDASEFKTVLDIKNYLEGKINE
ncbi:MAG: phosphopantetheine-binding protein [Peptostreptococcaceae bacterium]|jgi:acyl carrier protein|nr:phosphopantetheine-binding protein [Peptostreptococcaceae bacterium]